MWAHWIIHELCLNCFDKHVHAFFQWFFYVLNNWWTVAHIFFVFLYSIDNEKLNQELHICGIFFTPQDFPSFFLFLFVLLSLKQPCCRFFIANLTGVKSSNNSIAANCVFTADLLNCFRVCTLFSAGVFAHWQQFVD